MNKYRKLIAAFIGCAALVAVQHYNVNLPGLNDVVLEIVIAAATSFGVYQVRNEPT